MAKNDRTGNRKTREQRKQFKVPELGYTGAGQRAYRLTGAVKAGHRCQE